MLERHSALQSAKPYSGQGLTIVEAPDFTLNQYAGAEKLLKNALGKIPARTGVAPLWSISAGIFELGLAATKPLPN